MNTAFVINSKKFPYHERLLEIFGEAVGGYGGVQCFDMADGTPLHEKYYAIRDCRKDLLITFDCAGFELRTENDTLSYNNMGCRMAHILFHGMHEYREELRQQMNFSMFVFSMRSEDVKMIQERYPNIPNIELMEQMEYKEITQIDKLRMRNITETWFRHLLQEAYL